MPTTPSITTGGCSPESIGNAHAIERHTAVPKEPLSKLAMTNRPRLYSSALPCLALIERNRQGRHLEYAYNCIYISMDKCDPTSLLFSPVAVLPR